MELNPVFEAALNQTRRALVEQRAELTRDIDAAIAQIDSMLHDNPATAPRAAVEMTATSTLTVGGPPPAMRDAVMTYMKTVGHDVTTNEVAVTLADQYGWGKASVRSLISKMGKAGDIHMRRRGVYGLTPNPPTDTSGPADDEAGPEGNVTTSGAGGDADDAPGHDPDNAETGWNRDRGGDPAVAGAPS